MRPALLRSCLRSACTSSGLQNAPASMLHRCRQQLGWRAAAATAAQQQQQLSLAAARPLHGWGCQHRCQQDPRLASSPQQQLLLQRQQPASRRFAAAAARGGGLDSLSASTDVGTAIRTAVAAAGRTVGAADEALINALVDNWYHTAGDVAAMSQDELEVLRVPVKLWALLNAQLQTAAAAAEPSAAAGNDDVPAAAEAGEAASRPAASSSSADAAADAAAEALQMGSAAEPLPADIMQRRMPERCHSRRAEPVRVRHVQLRSREPYGLKAAELTPRLREELEALERFSCTRFYGQLVEPLAPVTYRSVTRHYALLMLGFAHRVRGVPLDQLSLRTLVPSSGRDGVSLVFEYQHWRQHERGTALRTSEVPLKAALHIARFLYHDVAKVQPPSEAKQCAYHDVEVVKELSRMQAAVVKDAARAPRVADDRLKWLQWDEFLTLVRALRAECAGLTASGQPRPRREVAASLQRYLIVAILSVVPDRQRTLRELEVGRTLLRRDGGWVIKHGPGDYKTGKQYGDRPPLVIAPFIYPELEAFIDTWRHELRPQSAALFVRPRTGRPFDDRSLYKMFVSAVVRLTGKATNPHLVRDMIVTHLRMQKKSEAQMEALALYMGHSLDMQRKTYDKRTQDQKLKPAVDLLQQLSGRLAVTRLPS